MDCTAVTTRSPCLCPGGKRAPIRVSLLLCVLGVSAHTVAVVHGQEPGGLPKRVEAMRVSEGAVRLDGRLDEAIWTTAVPISDFIQREPDEGAVPTDRIEVRFAYDDSAL